MSEQTTSYAVEGMTCSHCVDAVSTEVGSIEGVEDVDVDLATGRVTVRSTRVVPLDEVARAVDEAGYHLVDGTTMT